jgi:hypothetical protein
MTRRVRLAELFRPSRDPSKQEVLLWDSLDIPVICFMEDVDEVLDWMLKGDDRFREIFRPGEEYIRLVRVVH